MIHERTHYYAKPGMEAAVLAARRRACAVRVQLGLAAGTIRTRLGAEGPDVTWECPFPSIKAQEADLAARAGSAAFEAVRVEMRGLIKHFDRLVEATASPLADHWAGERDLLDIAVVPHEIHCRSAGHALVGYLYLPPGPGPFPCMITNHGSGIQQGTEDVCRPACGALLMSWGIASFLPHRRGYGNSAGPPWREEVSAAFGTPEYDAQLVARLDAESEDILAALSVVEGRPEIMPDRIGVMGSSFGGTTTLLAAAKSDRFRCAVEFAGAAMNWERTPALRAAMTEAARRLSHPIFFVQAANDYSIAPTLALSEACEGAGKRVQSRIYPQWGLTPEEGHLFESRGMQIWGGDVRRFLERWL
jgi:carboxymethylenebutenolidase